jgi:hypothetical protein
MTALTSPAKQPNLIRNLNYPECVESQTAVVAINQGAFGNSTHARLLIGVATLANLNGPTTPTLTNNTQKSVERPLNQIVKNDDPVFFERSALLFPSDLSVFERGPQDEEPLIPRQIKSSKVTAYITQKEATSFPLIGDD